VTIDSAALAEIKKELDDVTNTAYGSPHAMLSEVLEIIGAYIPELEEACDAVDEWADEIGERNSKTLMMLYRKAFPGQRAIPEKYVVGI